MLKIVKKVVSKQLKHILGYITSNKGGSPESINDLERIHLYTPYPPTERFRFTRKKIYIIQERSLLISKDIFLQKLIPYVPTAVITSLESILNCFMLPKPGRPDLGVGCVRRRYCEI